jgi:iron complex transport system ATP-binding protein
MRDTVLRARNLTIGYRHRRQPPTVVAEDISVFLEAGELVCLLGPNGVGKSTLMRTLAGMQPPLSGDLLLNGVDIRGLAPRERARHLSVVLTDRVDVGNLSAYELVALGRHPYTDWTGKLTAHDEEVVRWAIRSVGAVPLAHRCTHELSDGERQKILIARALAQEPKLMLLDEPTAFLDLPRRVEIMGVLRDLARRTRRTILLSTHDLDLALRSADRLWLLPPGGPLEVGAPEDLVLSGAFEAAFRSEGVEFDRCTGSFRLNHQQAGVINLVGEGIATLWTVRALEREGYLVAQNGNSAPVRIEVARREDRPSWWLRANGHSEEHASLYDLLAAVRKLEDPTEDS